MKIQDNTTQHNTTQRNIKQHNTTYYKTRMRIKMNLQEQKNTR